METARLIAQLKDAERFVPHAYQDSLGYWTIGYGRLIDKRLGGGISRGEAEQLLTNDVNEVIQEMNEHLPWVATLDEVRQRVVADMMFNLGWVKLSKFKNTLAAMQAGDYTRAAEGMRKSLWYKQVGRRARRLVIMMTTGVDPQLS